MYKFKIYIHQLVILIFATLIVEPIAASDDEHFRKILSKVVNDANIVGLAAAVVRNGEVSFIKTYGSRDTASSGKVDQQTTFRIASLSKAFAATVAVQLELEDKLSLEASAVSFNRSFRLKDQAQAESVTLTDVLSHRLSLPPYAYDNLLEAGKVPSNILSEMRKVTPICKVGRCYAYQNVGFNMIAPAIETVEERSYATSVEKRLFEPLGMTGASFGKDALLSTDNWASSYTRTRNGKWRLVSVKQPYYDVPAAGGVNANIVDMSHWLLAQLGNAPNVLSKQALRRLQAPQVSTPRESRRVGYMSHITETHYGLGWRIYQYKGAKVVTHSGSVEGYGAQIAFIPEMDAGIVLLTNSKTREFWRILPKFLDLELGL